MSEVGDQVINEKLKSIILYSARRSFSRLIEKDPKFLNTPIFQDFVENLANDICKSLKRAYVIG